MDLEQIVRSLHHPDLDERLRSISTLRAYDSSVAVPLLCGCLQDPEFIVRSLVATILGYHRMPAAFLSLVQLLERDEDAHVRGAAASALALFGEPAIVPLLNICRRDRHWFVRRSIINALMGLPLSGDLSVELFNLCALALRDPQESVQQVGIEALRVFANTPLRTAALDKLIPLAKAGSWQIRMAVCRSLHHFDHHQAREALIHLRQDPDHRVVGAALEGLVHRCHA